MFTRVKFRIVRYLVCALLSTVCAAFAQKSRVTINVIVPPSTPDSSTIYIAGNSDEAGNWNPGKVALSRQHDSLWSVTLQLPREFGFEYKITRGTWRQQALYGSDAPPENSKIRIGNDTAIFVFPTGWSEQLPIAPGGITGTVRFHHDLAGEGLDYKRDLVVWLPPSYDKEPGKRYPVLYMHDGGNVFDPATSFSGYDWRVDEVTDSLIKAGAIREIIVVGIGNSPDRSSEYGDTTKGGAYQKFVVKQVKPLIDSAYRTLPDRKNTAVMGSSMGGLVSFLLAWNYPEVFSQAACLSPAFWPKLTDRVEHYAGPDKKIRIYMDDGTIGLEKELRPGCDNMLRALKKQQFDARNLIWFLDEGAEHHERFWARRVWRPLEFMFGLKD